MTLKEWTERKIPEYYDTMYLDGFEPWEILVAAHKSIMKNVAPPPPPDDYNIHITSEVKKP